MVAAFCNSSVHCPDDLKYLSFDSIMCRRCYPLMNLFVTILSNGLEEHVSDVVESIAHLLQPSCNLYLSSSSLVHKDVNDHNYFYKGMSVFVDSTPYIISCIHRSSLRVELTQVNAPHATLTLDVNSRRIHIPEASLLDGYSHWADSLRPGSPVDLYLLPVDESTWTRGVVVALSPQCSVYYEDDEFGPVFLPIRDIHLSSLQKPGTVSFGAIKEDIFVHVPPIWEFPCPEMETNNHVDPPEGLTAGPILFHNEYPKTIRFGPLTHFSPISAPRSLSGRDAISVTTVSSLGSFISRPFSPSHIRSPRNH